MNRMAAKPRNIAPHGNPPMIGEYPSEMTSNAESVPIIHLMHTWQLGSDAYATVSAIFANQTRLKSYIRSI